MQHEVLISHEVPKQLFQKSLGFNSYPYLLAHLLSHKYHYNKEYAEFYKKIAHRYEYSICDNSCFELGFPVDNDTLIEVALEYGVTHVVIPDAYQDFKGTVELADKNIPKLEGNPFKLFSVLQGKSYEEMFECYDYFSKIDSVDVIGINFMRLKESDNAGRLDFFRRLIKERAVTKKIHFLGAESINEFISLTKEEKQLIYSVDTSNPIITGWNLLPYTKEGFFYDKPKEKLAENLNIELNQEQLEVIINNIKIFKEIWNS